MKWLVRCVDTCIPKCEVKCAEKKGAVKSAVKWVIEYIGKCRDKFVIKCTAFATPKFFYLWSGHCLFPLFLLFLITFVVGVYQGVWVAPADYQQGELFRIIYVHVPAAFLSLFIYTIIFGCSVIFLIWRLKVADIIAGCSAAIGASFTFLALFTGALCGKPMWGTYWVWDARLTSELILLFLYFGYMGLRGAISNLETRAKAAALFAIVGMVDVPIVHFSVNWWQTLHQGATLSKLARPSIANEMLFPLLYMIAAFMMFYVFLILYRGRTEILLREKRTQWVGGLEWS